MNRNVLYIFVIIFRLIPKHFCNDDELEIYTPKIISSTKMLLGKPFKMICKARIPIDPTINFSWQYDEDDMYITLNQSILEKWEEEEIIETTLIFSEVKKHHTGQYRCTLTTRKDEETHSYFDSRHFEVLEHFHVPKFDPESYWYIIDAGSILTLTCSGKEELVWKKYAVPPTDPFSKQELSPILERQDLSIDKDEDHPFISTIRLKYLQAQDTGNYSCVYKAAEFIDIDVLEMEKYHLLRNAYVFVKDEKKLYVETPKMLMEKYGFPMTIPCRPTFPEVEVVLYKSDDDTLLYPRAYETQIKFSQTDGFTIPTTQPYKTKSSYTCVFSHGSERREVFYELLSQPTHYSLVKPTFMNFKPNPEIGQLSFDLICHMPYLKVQPRKMAWKMHSRLESIDVEESKMQCVAKGHYSVCELRLTINKISEVAIGEYICGVYGEYNLYTEASMNLEISYPRAIKPIIKIDNVVNEKTYTVERGGSVTLTCLSTVPIEWKRSFMDVPEFDVTAKISNFNRRTLGQPLLLLPKRGQVDIPLLQYNRTFDYEDGTDYPYVSTITLTKMNRKGVGFYSCMHSEINLANYDAYDLTKQDIAAAVYIYVTGTNKLDVPSIKEITGVQNELIVIPCLPCEPSIQVALYKNEEKVPEDKYIFEKDSGFVLTDTKTIGMEEKYTCELSLDDKVEKIDYLVSAIPQEIPPEIPAMIVPKNRPLLGTTIKLGCSVKTPLHLPFSFNIFHPQDENDERIKIEKNVIHQNVTISTIEMTITNLTAEDEGDYECEVYDFFNRTKSTNFFLYVYDSMEAAPTIKANSADLIKQDTIELNTADDLRLRCDALSKPTWYKLGKKKRPQGDFTLEAKYFENFQKSPLWLLENIDDERSSQITSIRDESLPFSTELILITLSYKDVGYYVCVDDEDTISQNKDLETLLKQKRARQIYLYVKDYENLHAVAPKRLKFKINTKLVIPCKPSSKEVTTELQSGGNLIKEDPDSAIISYDDKEGFLVHPGLLSANINEFICVFHIKDENDNTITKQNNIVAVRIFEEDHLPKIDLKPMVYGKPYEIICFVQSTKETSFRLEWIEYPTKSNQPDPNIKTLISKENVTNEERKVSNKLTINAVNVRNQGIFKCKMEDIYGNVKIVQQNVKIFNYTLDPPIITPGSEIMINPSEELKLVCRGEFPVTWKVQSIYDRPFGDVTKKAEALKKGQILNANDAGLSTPNPRKFDIEDSGTEKNYLSTLILKRAYHKDTGFYSCVYTKKAGRTNINNLELTGKASRVFVFVHDPDHIFKPPYYDDILYVENTVFTIPCLPTSRDVTVDLYNDNNIISNDNTYITFDPRTGFTIHNDSVLNIDKEIKCSFHKEFTNLQFQEFHIKRIPTNYEKEDVVITNLDMDSAACKTKLPKNVPYFLRWTAQKQELQDRIYTDQSCIVSEFYEECELTMKIYGFTFADSGNYFCEKVDFFENTQTSTTTLIKMNRGARAGWRLLYQTPGQMYCRKSFGRHIIFGEEAQIGEFPWMARVGYRICPQCKKIEYFCAGSLIGPQFVMTAANCINSPYVEEHESPLPVVRLGDHRDVGKEPSHDQVINAAAIKAHPYYEDGAFYDIGIIILQHPAILNRWVYPICLPRKNLYTDIYKDYEFYKLAGWGARTNNIMSPMTDELITGLVELDSSEQCRRARPRTFCISGNAVPCRGDAGSPIMWMDENKLKNTYFEAGLISKITGDRCQQHAVSPNVSCHLDFILRTVEKLYTSYYGISP